MQGFPGIASSRTRFHGEPMQSGLTSVFRYQYLVRHSGPLNGARSPQKNYNPEWPEFSLNRSPGIHHAQLPEKR